MSNIYKCSNENTFCINALLTEDTDGQYCRLKYV